MLKRFITTKMFEPLYYRFYRKDDTLKYFKIYKKLQWASLKENEDYARTELYNILEYAIQNIPYYKDFAQKHAITISKKTIFEDLRKFPILTKDIARKEFDNLYKIIPGLDYYFNNSGGSTGEPVKIMQDKRYWAESYAVGRLQYEWADYQFGEPLIKLWGSEADIMKEKKHFKNRFASWMRSTYILNTFKMDEKSMLEHIKFINKKKPKLLLAYVQSIDELARFIKQHDIKVHQPKAIMTSAGTLYQKTRSIVQEVFGCKIFDRYGSREVGPIACECEEHKGLHIASMTHYVEVLNKKMQPCKEGESGELYITLLSNYTMPLIRYQIGDLGVYTNKKCACGRGLPILKQVVGRTNSLLRTNKGVFDSVAISALLYYYEGNTPFQSFSKYQIIQESKSKIIFKVIVKKKALWKEEKRKILEKFSAVLGEDVKITFQETKSIPPLKSGKYVYIINNMESEQ